MKSRNLKIEETGDFWRKRTKPVIRLTGHWLARAGFPPGQRVTVEIEAPGVLRLTSVAST